jgi:hypothetical protein
VHDVLARDQFLRELELKNGLLLGDVREAASSVPVIFFPDVSTAL